MENKLILHASGSSRQTFVDGFYLYFIKEEKKEGKKIIHEIYHFKKFPIAWRISLLANCFSKNCSCFINEYFSAFLDEPEKRRFWFSDSGKGTEEELLSSYNIQWLEVAVWRKKNGKDDVIRCLQNPLPRDITDKVKGKTEDSIYNGTYNFSLFFEL